MSFERTTPTPCTCCQEGHGTSDCWSQAYERGRHDFISEIHTVLATDFEGHHPGHDCDVCHITRAMALRTPSLQEVMQDTTDWFITIVSDPEARESLKSMIAATEDAERRN